MLEAYYCGGLGPETHEIVKKILVVEDDPAVQRALKRLFEAEEFAVEIRSDGRSALEAFRSAAPSAVILDLRLPEMSGSEVCREIKKKAPALPVIVLSAKTDVTDKVDRKSTRLNSSHIPLSRMPSSA